MTLLAIVFSISFVSYGVLFILWMSCISFSKDDTEPKGFITYKNFKKFYHSVEWYQPTHQNQFMLRKKGESIYSTDYELFPSIGRFIFDGKHMLPISPLTFLLIVLLVCKHDERAKLKENNKYFIWKVSEKDE